MVCSAPFSESEDPPPRPAYFRLPFPLPVSGRLRVRQARQAVLQPRLQARRRGGRRKAGQAASSGRGMEAKHRQGNSCERTDGFCAHRHGHCRGPRLGNAAAILPSVGAYSTAVCECLPEEALFDCRCGRGRAACGGFRDLDGVQDGRFRRRCENRLGRGGCRGAARTRGVVGRGGCTREDLRQGARADQFFGRIPDFKEHRDGGTGGKLRGKKRSCGSGSFAGAGARNRGGSRWGGERDSRASTPAGSGGWPLGLACGPGGRLRGRQHSLRWCAHVLEIQVSRSWASPA